MPTRAQLQLHIKRLLTELDRAHKAFEPFEGFCPAGVDPTDSAELMRLRGAIDDHLPWPSERARERGDYAAAIKHAAKLTRRVKR